VETHLHADFVSGHRELAERTGATIYLGEGFGQVMNVTGGIDAWVAAGLPARVERAANAGE
jgi:glyoxylase-like metal-dependent hydrolase (beta-lactamase superfamily II)